jgi:spectinomycin phosphotransferase
MLQLFDLEWRLDEIDQYAGWFAAPHTGSTNDQIAFGGLQFELDRPDRSRSVPD